MNKKIISSVLAAAMLLTVSTSNIYAISASAEKNSSKTKTESVEENAKCNVHFVLFVPEDFKNEQKEVILNFRGNGEEFSGLLTYSSDYNLNIQLQKEASYELTFSGDIEGYEILGVEPYIYFEEDDNLVTITMARFDEQSPAAEITEQSDGELTEEERIVKNYIEKLNVYMETYPNDFETYTVLPNLLQNYLKRAGEYYNTETWDTLSDMEKGLYYILYDHPNRMFKDKYELLQPEEIIKSDAVLTSKYNLGGSAREFVELTTTELWTYQLEQTKATGAVPDYFTIYMDLKSKTNNEPAVEEPKETEAPVAITTTSKTTETEAPKTETPITTTKNEEAKKAVKNAGNSILDTLKQNKITIILLIVALIGVILFRFIDKIRKQDNYDDE